MMKYILFLIVIISLASGITLSNYLYILSLYTINKTTNNFAGGLVDGAGYCTENMTYACDTKTPGSCDSRCKAVYAERFAGGFCGRGGPFSSNITYCRCVYTC